MAVTCSTSTRTNELARTRAQRGVRRGGPHCLQVRMRGRLRGHYQQAARGRLWRAVSGRLLVCVTDLYQRAADLAAANYGRASAAVITPFASEPRRASRSAGDHRAMECAQQPPAHHHRLALSSESPHPD